MIVTLLVSMLIACAAKEIPIQKNLTLEQMMAEINTTPDPAFVYAYEKSKFVPPAGKTLLIMGQNHEEIADYMDSYLNPVVPGGWMAYWGIPSLNGIRETHLNETGTSQNHQNLVERYPDTVLQSALWMVGKWGVLDKTANGDYDAVVTEFSQWAKDTNRPIYLRIGYEFDGAHNELEPETYIKAYQRIVDLIRSEGAENIAFVWHSYAAPPFKDHPLSSWYPGDDYVDWVGISLFGHLYADRLNAEAEAVFDFARSHKKPVMVAESSPIHGIDHGNTNAWRWFANYFSLIYEKNIKAVSFINSNWNRMTIDGISEWEDARMQNNKKIYQAWLKETNQARYLKQSPNLFEQLGFAP
ncbi:MAG: glycosyl hydrolase [Pseudomonadota bacterium]